ncbi:reverse transcriptase domain-containing protein [Tanacetum coccineum]
MPLSIWRELNLLALTKTRMILELADRTISTPTGIAEDVFVKVGTFFFPTDFVVVDYVVDPRAPLNLRKTFLEDGTCLNRCSRSPSFTPFGGSEYQMEEIDEILNMMIQVTTVLIAIYDSDVEIVYLE